MENQNYFYDWISNYYKPSLIVYSTDSARSLIERNNLSPAELLRPFGDFTGLNINFSFADKYTVNMKNFKLDFFDSEKYKQRDESINNEIERVLELNKPGIGFPKVFI